MWEEVQLSPCLHSTTTDDFLGGVNVNWSEDKSLQQLVCLTYLMYCV